MEVPRGGLYLGKRKEREHYYPLSTTSQQAVLVAPKPHYYPSSTKSQQAVLLAPKPPPSFARPDPRGKPDRPAPRVIAKPSLPPPGASQGCAGNKLLAGYLAHEFLRCGTLLGERRVQPPPPGRKLEKEPAAAPEPGRRYAEVSRLLMAGGARIPGVVNPAQLGRWLRIKE